MASVHDAAARRRAPLQKLKSSELHAQQKAMALVLSQIHSRALRTHTDAAQPLSLIELIEASYAVFARHGITTPEDARYHRLLLTLSVDPSSDWPAKIQRLCKQQQQDTPQRSLKRQDSAASSDADRSKSQSSPSYSADARESTTPWPSPSTPSVARSRAHSTSLRSERKPQDRFGDMLSFTNEMLQDDDDASSLGNHSTPPRENESRSRNATAAILPVRFPGPRSSKASSSADRQAALSVSPMPTTAAATPWRNSDRISTPAKKAFTQKAAVKTAHRAPSSDPVERRKRDDRSALLAITFQRWRANQHMKRIVKQHRQQHIQRMRAAITPMYTAAVFRWVTRTLPEQHRFQTESHAMPTDVLRRLSNILQAKELTVLYKSNQKLDRWRMKSVLKIWARDTTKKRRFGDQALKRRRREVLNTAFQCLQTWQYFTEMRKCETQRCVWISQKHHRHILRDCLFNWQSALAQKQRIAMHTRTHAASVLRKVCRAWHECVVKQRVRKTAVERSCRKRGIRRWKQWVVCRYLADQSVSIAREHVSRKIIAWYWQAWREYLRRRAATSSKLTFHQTRRRYRQKQLVFASWFSLVAQQQELEAKRMRFSERRWTRQLSHLYQAWAELTQRKRFQSITVLESLHALDKRRLQRVWRQWGIHLDQVEQANAERILAIKINRKRWLWTVWRRSTGINMALRTLMRCHCLYVLGTMAMRWAKFTRLRQRKAKLEEHARVHYMRRLWQLSWRSLLHHVRSRRQQRTCIESMIASNERDTVYQTLQRWISFTKRRHAITLRAHEASSSVRRDALITPCWNTWRQVFRWKRKLHLAVLHLQRNNRQNCFARWKKFRLNRRLQKLQYQKLQLKWQRVGVIRVFKHWQIYHKQQHALVVRSQTIGRRHRAMLLDRAWQYWRASLFTVLTQRSHVARILFKRESQSVQSYFGRWKARWSYSRRHRRLLLTMLSGSKERTLGQYFGNWKRFTRERKRRQSILLDAESYHVRRLTRNAVVQWRSMKMHSQEAKAIIRQCLQHWQHQSILLQFKRWQRFRLYQKQQAVWSKIARCHSTRALLSITMTAWRARIHQQRRKKAQIKQTAENMQRWRLRRAFLVWHQRSHRAKRLNSLQQHAILSILRGRTAMIWSQWKNFVQAKRRRRTEISTRNQQMVNYRMSASIETWCKYVRMRKCIQSTLLRVETFSKEARQRQIWVQWTRLVSRQRLAHALEEKACVFHVFCLVPKYFRLWQSFYEAKRHRKQLLLHATGMLRHNYESRAFATWVDWIKLRKQLQRACFLWRNQTLIRCWTACVRFKAQSRRKHRNQSVACTFHQRRALTTSFATWHSTMRWSQLLRRCTQRTSSQWQRHCFDSWVKAANIKKSARDLIGRMQIGTCARIFQVWKALIRHQTEQTQHIQARFIRLWKNDMLIKTWARWRQYSRKLVILKRKQYELSHRSQKNFFRSWKNYVEYRSRVRIQAAQLMAITSAQKLQSAWVHWRQYQLLRSCVRFMRGNTIAERGRRRLRIVFRMWHEWSMLSAKITQQVQTQSHKLLRHVLINGFYQHTLHQRHMKAITAQLGQLHQKFAYDWLVEKVHQRMSVILICEDVKRHTNLLKIQATIWKHWVMFLEQKRRKKREIDRFQARLRGGRASGHAHHALTRWMHLQTANFFNTWLVAVSNQKRARMQSIAALERWKYVHSTRFFTQWRAWCVSKKKRAVIAALYVERKQTRTWVAWRTFVAINLDCKRKWSVAAVFQRHHTQFTIFQVWRQSALARRLREHCVAERRHVRNMRYSAALFASWTQFTMTSRAKSLQHTVVQLFRSTQLSRRLLDAWKEYVALVQYHRNQLQLNTERLQILILCASFRAWHDWSSKQRKLVKAMHIFGWRCDTKTAKSVFSAWHLYVHAKRTLAWKIHTFQQHRTCKRAVHSWHEFALVRKQQSETHQRAKLFLSIMKGQQLTCRFMRWKQFSMQVRQHRTALRHYYTKLLLPKYWNAWLSVIQNKHQLQDRLKHVLAQWTHDTLRRAWLGMRAYHVARRQHQDRLLTADAHFLDAQLRYTIKRWRTTTSMQKHNLAKTRTVLVRWRLRTCYKCFLRWQMFHGKIKALQFQFDLVSQNTDRQRILGSWYTWRKLFMVQRAGTRRLLRRVWSTWRNRYRLHRVRVLLQGKTEQSTQRHMLMRWRKFVYNSKLKQTMMLMCSGLSNTQIVKRMWLRWHRFVVTSRSNRHKIRQVLLHIQCHRQFAILKNLQTNVMLERHKRSELMRVQQLYHSRLQNRCWQAWKAHVDVEHSHRDKLKFYVNMLQHSHQKKRFTMWKAFTDQQQLLKRNLALLFSKRSQLSAQKVFDGWKVFVTKQQQCYKAQNLCDSTRARYVFKHWRQHIVICKMERMMGASRSRQLESMFLTWRKVVTKTQQVRRLQKNVRLSGELAQQHLCFQSWRQWSQLHARVKRILVTAAFGHRLRFRFLLWKQFTDNRQRLKMMLVGDTSRLLQPDAEVTSIAHDHENDANDQAITSVKYQAAFVASALARKARFFQRLELDWSDITQVWPRWRHAFHAKLFYRLRKVHVPLIRWQHWASRQRMHRLAIDSSQRRRCVMMLQSNFNGWRSVVAGVKQLQLQRKRDRELWTIVNTEMVRKGRKTLKLHWRRWSAYVEEKRHLQNSLDMYHKARLVTKFWLLWSREYLHAVRHSRQQERSHRHHLEHSHLQRSVKRWKSRAACLKRHRLILEYFANRNYDRSLAIVVCEWKRWVRQQRRIRQFSARHVKRNAVLWLRTWRSRMRSAKKQRMQLQKFSAKRTMRLRAMVWMHWVHFLDLGRDRADAIVRAECHYLHQRLRLRWRVFVHAECNLRNRAQHSAMQLQAWKAQRAARRWYSQSSKARRARLCEQFILHKHLTLWRWHVKQALACRYDNQRTLCRSRKIYFAWRQWTRQHRSWREIVWDVQMTRDRRYMATVWAEWQSGVERSLSRKTAIQHREFSSRRMVLRQWFAAVEKLRSVREDRMEQAALHADHGSLRAYWFLWLRGMQIHQRKRAALLTCMVKLSSLADKRLVEVLWRAWARVFLREKHCRALLATREIRTRQRVLARWKTWLQHKRSRSRQYASADKYFASRLLGVTFFFWQNYALAWKDVAEEQRTHPPVVRTLRPIAASSSSVETAHAVEVGERPMSPVMKRLRQTQKPGQQLTPSLPDAAALTLDVKKRLMLLGKWRADQHK